MPQTASAPQPTTTVADNSAFGGPNAAQAAAANAALAKAPSSPLLVTSAASRTTTAGNVASLNTAATNAAAGNAAAVTPAAGTPGSSTNGGPNAQKNTPTGTSVAPSSSTSSSTTTAPAGTTQVTLPSGAIGFYNQSNNTMTDSTGNPLTYNNATGAWIDPSTGVPPVAATPAASDSTDGTDSSGVNETDIASAVSGLPPSLQAFYGSNLTQLAQQQQNAKNVLAQAQATLANDPAASAAVAAISAKYDVLIQAMNLKNKQVLGKASTSVGAFGGLGVMSTSFMSDEMDAASGRISNLVSEQQNAILAAQAAYSKEDLAAFNSAMDNYNKTITAMNTALSDLNTATDKAVTATQNQQKIDAAASKAAVTNDVTLSTNLGTAIAKNLSDAGVTDPTQVASYIQQMAQQYGITDPAILQSAVVKAQQDAQKASDTSANTLSEIQKRNQPKVVSPKSTGGGTDGAYTYTGDDIATYTNFLNKGGTADGQSYAARGTDSYVDPGAYIYAYEDWIGNGGTPAGFIKKFPITNVNPASYGELPAGLQPKAKTTAAAPL